MLSIKGLAIVHLLDKLNTLKSFYELRLNDTRLHKNEVDYILGLKAYNEERSEGAMESCNFSLDMDVSANYNWRNAFVIVNFVSTDNMTFENSDGRWLKALKNSRLIKELGLISQCNGCRRCSDSRKENVVAQLLTD
ncbi:hypothetical protein Tco_1409835 [Tanacetum coccineum]